MKKVLIASTALVMLAGAAAAEVALSGDARLGFVYDGEDLQFSSRARVKFTLSGETDAGLAFGASFRVDQENYNANRFRSAARGTAGSVWISGSYGKLSMGDTLSAAEKAIGDLVEIGYTDGTFLDDAEEISYLSGDGENTDQGPNVLYEYSIDAISLYASASDGSARNCPAVTGALGCDDTTADKDTDFAYSLAAKYDAGNWNAALAFGKHGDAQEIVLGGEYTVDAFAVKAFYADYDERVAEEDGLGNVVWFDKSFGLSGEYKMANGVGLQAFWIRRELSSDTVVLEDENIDAYGIGAFYDLGGGATLAGAIGKNEAFVDNETRADLGVKFSF